MKTRLFLILCLLVAGSAAINAQVFNRYGDCSTGRGVCGVSSENAVSGGDTSAGGSRKFGVQKINDTTVQMIMYKANITSADEYKIFGAPVSSFSPGAQLYFYNDANVPLTATIKSVLGLPDKANGIKAGAYAVTVYSTYYKAYLKLY